MASVWDRSRSKFSIGAPRPFSSSKAAFYQKNHQVRASVRSKTCSLQSALQTAYPTLPPTKPLCTAHTFLSSGNTQARFALATQKPSFSNSPLRMISFPLCRSVRTMSTSTKALPIRLVWVSEHRYLYNPLRTLTRKRNSDRVLCRCISTILSSLGCSRIWQKAVVAFVLASYHVGRVRVGKTVSKSRSWRSGVVAGMRLQKRRGKSGHGRRGRQRRGGESTWGLGMRRWIGSC
jgi:hypothetical protein